MKVAFLILFILLLPIANASSVTRTINYNNINYTSPDINISGTNRDITIYLTPSPISDFDNPGYYIEEHIPSGTSFLETNADWHEIVDNKIHIIRLLPNTNTQHLYYKIRLQSETGDYIFNGLYKDDQNTASSISVNRLTFNYVPYYEQQTQNNSNKKLLPTPTPIPIETPELVDIITIVHEPIPAKEIPILFYFIVLLIPVLLYLKIKFDPSNLIMEVKIDTTPMILNIKNSTSEQINLELKTKNISPTAINITTSCNNIAPPHTVVSYNITSTEPVQGLLLVYRKDFNNN